MKLYFSPSTSSLAVHIALLEMKLPFSLVEVDLDTLTFNGGMDYCEINPKGYVPLLEINEGVYISELAVILHYLAEQTSTDSPLIEHSDLARIRMQEMLAFIATELHKAGSFMRHPRLDQASRCFYRQWLRGPYELVDQHLSTTPWMLGDHFTVADIYTFVTVRMARSLGICLNGLDALDAFMACVQTRPSVIAALRAEAFIVSTPQFSYPSPSHSESVKPGREKTVRATAINKGVPSFDTKDFSPPLSRHRSVLSQPQ